MRTDPKTEPLVREAMNVGGTAQREEAPEPFENPDTAAEALRLTTGIVLSLLHREFEGEPDDTDLDEVADEVPPSESWSKLTRAEIRQALRGVTTGTPPTGVGPQAVFVAAPVRGA